MSLVRAQGSRLLESKAVESANLSREIGGPLSLNTTFMVLGTVIVL